MKKKWFALTMVICLLMAMTGCKSNTTDATKATEIQVLEFSLSDYWSKVFDFHYEKNVGPVTTSEVAIEKAKEVWRERYGKQYEESTYPIAVAYDEENECWRVNETLPDKNHKGEDIVGATPHVLIKADGRVLAVWYG